MPYIIKAESVHTDRNGKPFPIFIQTAETEEEAEEKRLLMACQHPKHDVYYWWEFNIPFPNEIK